MYEDSHTVPPTARLCFQRWNVSPTKQLQISRHDDVATHLLYSEAKHYIENGTLLANPEQLAELETLADPSFPTERQYLELAQSLPGYASYISSEVEVKGEIAGNDLRIADGLKVTCEIHPQKLILRSAEV